MQGIICPDNPRQETAEGVVSVIEDPGDVFPDKVPKRSGCSEGMNDSQEFHGEVAAGIREPAAEPGYAECLAWCAGDDDVGQRNTKPPKVSDADGSEVAPQGMATRLESTCANIVRAESILKHTPRELFDLAGETPINLRTREFRRAYA